MRAKATIQRHFRSAIRPPRAVRRAASGLLGWGVTTALVLSSGLFATSPAAADEAFRVVPSVPGLHVRFEDGGEAAPCAALGQTPSATAVECWSAHVDRSVSRRPSSLESDAALACVDAYESLAPGQAGCPRDAAQCVRPRLAVFESLKPGLPVDTNIAAAWAMAADLAREYTAFQVLRNGYALNPHRPRIAGLALAEGMLVLSRAQAITALKRSLEDGGCATDHLSPYFDLASRVTEEVGGSDVPAILETHPPPGREWARRFYRVQLAVLGAVQGIRADGRWREDCERATAIGAAVGRLDADVNVWCGYAYEQLGMSDAAMEHWRLARRSPNHPEAASYADRYLKPVPGAAFPPTAAVEGR